MTRYLPECGVRSAECGMRRAVISAFLVMALTGCTRAPVTVSPCLLTGKSIIRKRSIPAHHWDVMVVSQVERLFHLNLRARAAHATEPGYPAEGGVGEGSAEERSSRPTEPSESSFITTRAPAQLTPVQIRRGPTVEGQAPPLPPHPTSADRLTRNQEGAGQAPTPPFTITKMKLEGKTPGFFVKDADSKRYLFKLDLERYPELLSGAEVVTSKLLYALGYYVPSYEVVFVAPEELMLGPSLTVSSDEQAELQEEISARVRDGRVRVSASRLLEGEILGPINFKQYQGCRALRALRVAYAWVNNVDAKDHNSLLVWTGDRALGYLIDFGTSLGADARRGAKRPCQGWVYDVDVGEVAAELFTLGLHPNGCRPHERPFSPAVGLWSTTFDPARWKPYVPNLAFQAMTEEDGRWMAARIAQFSRAQLEAAVESGQYSRPDDAARIVEVLASRQHAIVNTYLGEGKSQKEKGKSTTQGKR